MTTPTTDRAPQPPADSQESRLEFLRTVLDAMTDRVALLDGDGTITLVNAAWRQTLDFSIAGDPTAPRAQLGTSYLAMAAQCIDPAAHSESVAMVEAGIRDVLSGHAPAYNLQYPCRTSDRQHWFKLCVTPLIWNDQRGALITHSDITGQINAENALRESEQRFNSIANATPVMIWLSGTDAACYWFNAGWLAFTGRTLEQEQGNGWTQGVHPEDFQRCLDIYLSHFEKRLPFQMEYRLMHHSGQYRWIHDSGVPRFDAHGTFLGFIGSCLDTHEVRTIKDQLAAMAEVVPGVVYQFVTHPDGRWQFNYLSKGIEVLYGVSAQAACNDHNAMTLCILEEDRTSHQASVQQATLDLVPWQHEHRIRTPQGDVKWVRAQATPQPQADGSILWSGLLTDIQAQKELEERLRQGASVFANVQESIIITDANRLIVDVNAAFCRITGYSRAEVLGLNPRFLKSAHQNSAFYQAMWDDIDAKGYWIGEVFNRTKSGDVYAVMLNINAVRSDRGQITHYVGVATDINQLKTQQELLERVAHYDALTGLANRVLLSDRMRQAVAQSRRNLTKAAVCYLDLDGFKRINDTLGHDTGDQVLQTVAQRICGVLRASDTAARIGGDEFLVLLSDLIASESVLPMLDRLLQAIDQPIVVKGQSVSVGASIGVSLYPDNATEPDTLLRLADIAMYQAKESGKNCYRFSHIRPELTA